MVYCPKCGSENVDDAKFCINCGAEIKRVKLRKQEVQTHVALQQTEPTKPLTEKEKWKSERKQYDITKSSKQPLKSSLSNTQLVIAFMTTVVIISFVAGTLVANPLGIGGNKEDCNKSSTAGHLVTMSIPEFFDALHYEINNKTHRCYNGIEGVNNGDILKITGKIVQLVQHNETEIKDIGEYTSIILPYNSTMVLPVHVMGNVTAIYNVSDQVVITLHVNETYGWYEDLYGTTWYLFGEFFKEDFINRKFTFDLVIPPNQIEKI